MTSASSEDEDPAAREESRRRAAQDAAGELSRMGIDPGALGLEPAPAPPSSPSPLSAYPGSPVAAPGSPVGPPGSSVGPPGSSGSPVGPPGSAIPVSPGASGYGPGAPAAPGLDGDDGFGGGFGYGVGDPAGPGSNGPGVSGAAGVVFGGPAPLVGGGQVSWSEPGYPDGPGGGVGSVGSALNRPLGAALGSPAAAGFPPATPETTSAALEQLVPSPKYGIVMPASWRRMVRAVTFGLLAPGAADAVQREQRLVGRVRARQREPRTIAFIAGKGGVGTTTTAMGVSLTLAVLRNDPVVLVDTRTGTASMARRMAGRPAPSTLDLVGPDGTEAGALPLLLPGGLQVVDSPPWHSPVDRGHLISLIEDLHEDHPFTLLDVGSDVGDTAHGMLGRADQVVIVTAATHDAVEATRVALARIQQVDPSRVATAVIALVCLSSRAYFRVTRRLHSQLGLEASRVVPVPYDRALRVGDSFDAKKLRAVTREAYLKLAADIADVRQPAPAGLDTYRPDATMLGGDLPASTSPGPAYAMATARGSAPPYTPGSAPPRVAPGSAPPYPASGPPHPTSGPPSPPVAPPGGSVP